MTADAAIVAVRQVRPGAIETPSQEAYVRRMPPVAAKPHERSRHSIAGAVHDRARGALVGLAIGGALGTTIEFTRRDAKPKQTDLTRGGPFHLIPG